MDTIFQQAVSFTMKAEGGWYNGSNPADPNPTMHGVIQKTYDSYRDSVSLPRRSVQFIADNEVADIYLQYWHNGDCSSIETYSSKLAIAHFDTTFNSGAEESAKLLQRTVGADEDGDIGPQTIYLVGTQAKANETALVTAYLTTRLNFLKSLSSWSVEGAGWSTRLNNLATFLSVEWNA